MTINVRRTLLPLATSLALGLGLVAQQATAATLSTSAVIPIISGSGYRTEIPVLGLAQFDPANGTLTGIELGLHVESYDVTLSLGGWDDDSETGAGFESADLGMQISITVALPNGGGAAFATTSFGDTIYDEYDTISAYGEEGWPVVQDATDRLTDYELLSSFIGTGDVSILSLGILSFYYEELVTLDDGSIVGGSTHIDSFIGGPFTMTIDYTYTPVTPVPLPAGVWLFGSALLGLAGTRWRMV